MNATTKHVTTQSAARLLLQSDHIVILAHRKPDGDTLGSSFALLYALEALGKTARVECADGYPKRYDFLYGDYAPRSFEARFVVSADVAGEALLGGLAEVYPHIDLCIDHHKSNSVEAAHSLVDSAAPAAAQIVARVIAAMGVALDKTIADCLYTGLTTDTGCFKFQSVTAETHRLAATLIEAGADHGAINKRMFDNRTRGRMEVERLMLESFTYHFDGKCAVISLPADLPEKYGVTEDDLDGISALPRRVEGVLAGVTIRGNGDGSYRISLRSEPPVDSSLICATFGGGGHAAAAGCTMTGDYDDVLKRLLAAVEAELGRVGA